MTMFYFPSAMKALSDNVVVSAASCACVEHLKKIRRNEFGDCSFARQATIFKMLLGQAELILLFWEVCGMFQGKESVDLHARWTDVLGKVMTINERRGKEAEPYILFLQVVEQATHTIDIARRKDEAFNCRLGFFDYHNISLNLCLYPNAVYDYVVAYCSRSGKCSLKVLNLFGISFTNSISSKFTISEIVNPNCSRNVQSISDQSRV